MPYQCPWLYRPESKLQAAQSAPHRWTQIRRLDSPQWNTVRRSRNPSGTNQCKPQRGSKSSSFHEPYPPSHEPSEAPPGSGVRQSSGALAVVARRPKAPEDWRTPRRWSAGQGVSRFRQVLDCASALALFGESRFLQRGSTRPIARATERCSSTALQDATARSADSWSQYAVVKQWRLSMKACVNCANSQERGHPARSRFVDSITPGRLRSHLTGKTAAAWPPSHRSGALARRVGGKAALRPGRLERGVRLRGGPFTSNQGS